MKTVTNYAEKKAKQFLNLLQGYTKGIRFTAVLILLLMGVSNMNAADITSDGTARLYFKMNAISWWVVTEADGANYAYFFKDSKNAWSSKAVKYEGDTYYVVIPKGTWNNVILTRNSKAGAGWGSNLYNQTEDIPLSSSSNYIKTFKSGSNGSTASWGTAVKPASTGSLSASSASVNIGANVTLTPSLTSNQTINDIKSTTYSISPNSGASTSNNTFTATKSGTYTVTATITYNPDGYTSLTSEVRPTVTITVNPWTITWNPNGGSVTPTSSTYDGATAVSLPTPTRTGYNFDGWYTAASGGTKINDIGTTTKPTSNVTYYAHWTPKTYAITLNANGGASDGSATATYNNNTVTIASHPTRTDYRCNGYFTAATDGTLVLNTDGTLAKNVSGYTDANGNWTKDGTATLYAQWTYDVTEYIVTFSVETGSTSYGSLNAYNNTTSASITSPAQVRSGQSITFTATPETGYLVEGWYTDAACTAGKHDAEQTTYTTSIIGETNVYVKFVEQTWPVSFVASTGGTVSPAEEQTVGVITGVNISATPETGYTFSGWTSSTDGEFGDETAAETTFYPTAETTVTANFTENLFAITVQSSDNNHGTVTQSTDKAGIATTITITAIPNDGYRFINWEATSGITITDVKSKSTTVTATAEGTITANFELIPPTTIYLKPNSDWKQANARFAIYCWNSAGNIWYDMTKIDCDGDYYAVEIPGEYSDFKFVRMNPATTENNFNNGTKWNETGDLTVPQNDNILFSISDWGSGSWGAFTAPTYTITLDRQGGTTGDQSVTATYGSAAPSATMPTRTGYTFEGYYTETNGQGTLYINNTGVWQDIEYIDDGKWMKPACDLTLYAKWTAKTYAITLDANDGESNGSATVTYNSNAVTITSYPTRTDYRCEGYLTAATDGTLVLNADGSLAKNVSGYTDANGNWIKDEAVTLYAQWIYDVTEYIVTFGVETGSSSYGSLNAYNNTTSASITSPAQVRSGQSITFTATPETGYLVEGWYTDAACTAGKHDAEQTTYTTSIIGETNVYVKFVEQTWPVSFVASTGGTVSPAEEQTVGVITGVNISATPETGYTFAEWTSSAGGEFEDATAPETNFYPTAETTVTANFTENLFAITVTSNNDNLGTVTQSTDKAGIATAIEITATSKLGCRFVKWTATSGIIVDDENSATTTITTTCEGSLTAHFEKMPPTTIYLNPGSWTSDSARFSVYYWKDNDNAWAEMVKVDANSEYYTVDIPAGCQDIMMVRLKPTEPENKWENVWNQSGNLTIPTNGNNLYELDNKTVAYLHLKPNDNWTTDNARFAAYFFGNGEKWVDLVKKGDYYYTCEIPTDKNYPSVIFCRMNPTNKENKWENKWNQTGNLTIEKGNNLYTIGNEVWDEDKENKEAWSRLWDDSQWSKYIPSTTIQEQTGDYRMVYVESEVIGQAPYTKFHPAHSISKIADGTKTDTVSFYINKANNPAILLQQCATDGTTIEWNTIDTLTINGNDGANPARAHAPAKKAVELYIGEGCPAITGNGVYNFVLEQTNDDSHAAQILVDEIEPYNGNYYIRTYCTKGGWDNYQENPMTYSETALIHSDSVYDYYFCEWILRGKNIKYAVANDYSLCISDTLSSDDITNASTLPVDANVRFTWNSETNHLERAYLAGSGNASDRFLVLEGDANLKDVNGNQFKVSGLKLNEAIFKDMENWLYQLDVKANQNTLVKLTAKYNNMTQYFKGSPSETEQLIKGSDDDYTLRLIYDFKTNYLVSGLVGNQTITGNLKLEEVMIVRSHHDEAQTLKISDTGSVTANKAYGVMTFNKDTLNDNTKSQYERALYWVSFPFNVKLDEAFGFGNYGEHWIMEYYDGAERAEKGLWKEPTYSYWKFIEDPKGYILEAGQGYVLCLDLDLLGNNAEFWKHDNTEIALYFPSNGKDTIVINNQATVRETIVPEHECTIDRDDRKNKDSNWNIIGVPAYTKIAKMVGENIFYYQYNAAKDSFELSNTLNFNTMHAYMVQFADTINWIEQATSIAALAARKSPTSKDQYTLRLALQQEDAQCDHTFIRLQEDKATAEFDMNYDLCKIINRGANIYSMIGNVEVAANVLPVEERVIPLGLDIHETGNYTFAMPDGTDGITAILIDYETGKETNLLLADYTTELREGTNNERFALRVRPNHVATAVETIINGANGQIQKYIINGALYILNNGQLYDAQGRMVQP